MRLLPYLLCPALLLGTTAHGQEWVELMMDGSSNVHAVKAAFDAEWEGRSYERGQGWKQFQRWYWSMEQRTWPSGERPDPAVHLEAMEQVRAQRTSRSGERDAAIWEPLGPVEWTSSSYNPGNGRVNTIALDPSNPEVIYVGTPASGLWRSMDDGDSWEALFTDLPSMGVSGIVVHPTGPDTIYIATGDGDGSDTYSAGVLKSIDHGASWQSTGLNWSLAQTRTTRALRMHPQDHNTLYCAASSGIYRTVDSGETWQQLGAGSFRDLEFRPGDPTIVYACTDRFYRSTQSGTAFTTAGITGLPGQSEVGRMAIATSPANPLLVYVLCSNEDDNSFLGLYRSLDGGSTFTLRSDSPNIFSYSDDGDESGGQAWYDMALAVDPIDPDIVYVGGINVWKSIHGGNAWEIISHWTYPSAIGYTHADIHSLDILNGRLFCGSDGGIHVTDDAGGHWEDRSQGLDITQFYRLGGSELAPDLIMAGAQDNGSYRYGNGPWVHVYGADGMEAAVDSEDPSILYASYQKGGLMRSDNNGADWTGIGENVDDEGPWVTPFELDRTQAGRIVAGFRNVWATDDRGENWYPLTFWDEDASVRCLAIAPSDDNVVYAARNDRIERTLNAGMDWEDILPGLPDLSPTSIAVDPANPLHLWITFSGAMQGQKVHESFNGGFAWTNRSANLPNVPANSVAVQPGSAGSLYLGTDMGVYYTDDNLVGWEPYGIGMPNVVVSEVEVNVTAGKLRAATFGRGIWQADLFVAPFTGIAATGQSNGPRLVPLDNLGRFTVQGADGTGRITGVRIMDASGRTISERAWSGTHQVVDLSANAAGTYLVMILTDAGTWVRRVVR